MKDKELSTDEPNGQQREQQMADDNILRSELERARNEAAASRTELRDVLKQRDDALRDLAETQKKAQDLESKVLELSPLKDKVKEYQKVADGIVQERRDELLGRIPEDKREKYKGFDVAQLRVVVEDYDALKGGQQQQPPPAGSQAAHRAGENHQGQIPDIRNMTPNQVDDLKRSNPIEYERMLDAMVSTNPQLSNSFR